MKRYLLFTGNAYYPCGGVEDFVKSFDTMEAVTQHLRHLRETGDKPAWANVLDITAGTRYRVSTYDYKFRKILNEREHSLA